MSHEQQEVQRLTNKLDAASGVISAAQRLSDQLHIAGTTTVQTRYAIGAGQRPPDTHTTTILAHGPELPDAIRNLLDALNDYYRA